MNQTPGEIDQDGFLGFLCKGDDARKAELEQRLSSERSYVFDERLAKAGDLIDAGNFAFKAGDHEQAHAMYLAAAYQADFDYGQQWDMTPEHKGQIRAVKIRVLLNVANNCLKRGDYPGAGRACTFGLALLSADPNVADDPSGIEAKFLYRRARSQMGIENFTAASDDARAALALLPQDAAIREVRALAMAGVKQAKKVAADFWRGKDLFRDELGGSLPPVELLLTDAPPARTAPKPKILHDPSWSTSLAGLICCKRKRKSR